MNLKIGSYVKVKFVMRELGGCFSNYSSDNGEILQKDISSMDFYNYYGKELAKYMKKL